MSSHKKRKGVSYYFRLEFSTLQGKITTGFCSLGVFAIILMGTATYILEPAVENSQQLANEIRPASQNLALIRQSMLFASQGSDHSLFNNYSLNAKIAADSLLTTPYLQQEKKLFLDAQLIHSKVNSLLSKSKKLKQEDNLDVQIALTEDIKAIASQVASLAGALEQNLNTKSLAINEYVTGRTSNIYVILLISTLVSTILGATIGSFIVLNVLKVIRMLKYKILEISEGKLIGEIPSTKDELNSIVKALNELTFNLENIVRFSKEVGKGNFDTEVQVFDGKNELGEALATMRDSLKEVATAEENRTWSANGLARFGDLLRANSDDIHAYCQSILNEIIRYLNVNQGAFYIAREDSNEDIKLNRIATFAYGRTKYTEKVVEPGQGLVGQVFLEKSPIKLLEIPQNFTEISSGLGESTPNYLIIFPLIFNEKVSGVLELAAFSPLADYQVEFLEKLCENIASSLHHVESTNSTSLLLAEAQEMTKAMQMQEEMLRQNSEELMATQEQLSRDLEELRASGKITEVSFIESPNAQAVVDGKGNVLLANAAMQKLGIAQGNLIDHWIDSDKIAELAILNQACSYPINEEEYALQAKALEGLDSAHLIILHQQFQKV